MKPWEVTAQSVTKILYFVLVVRIVKLHFHLSISFKDGTNFFRYMDELNFQMLIWIQYNDGSDAHPASYPMSTASFLGGVGCKSSWTITLTTHPYLAPRLRMRRRYTYSPPCAYMVCSGTALRYNEGLYLIFKCALQRNIKGTTHFFTCCPLKSWKKKNCIKQSFEDHLRPPEKILKQFRWWW